MRRALLAVLLVVTVLPALGQEARLLPLRDPAYPVLERMQRRGLLPDLAPDAQPYATGAVRDALDRLDSDNASARSATEQAWVDFVRQRLGPAPDADRLVRLGLHATAGARIATSDRLDPWRPVGDGGPWLPHNSLHLSLERGALAIQGGWQMDYYYEVDPDGDDAVNRLFARSEDSYVGVRGSWFTAYVGRFGTHWGPFSEEAAFVSHNPRPYDQINVSAQVGAFTLRAILGELDNARPNGELGPGNTFDPGARRRFVSTHRLDFAPSPRFSVSLIEATLFSGTAAGPSLQYLLPTHIHLLTSGGFPRNEEYNLLLGALARARLGQTTWHVQALLDDFVVENRTAKEEAGTLEPTTFTLLSSVWLAPALRSGFGGALSADLGLTAEFVAYQTYNTSQPEGRYQYLGRGLATQFVDYVRIAARAPLYLDAVVPGLTLEPRLGVLIQGEQTLDQPYFRGTDGESPASILTGTPERTVHLGLDARLERPSFWLRIDLGLSPTQDAGFIEGASDTRTYARAEVGLRMSHWQRRSAP